MNVLQAESRIIRFGDVNIGTPLCKATGALVFDEKILGFYVLGYIL
jgi:hypothetical protein